MAPLRERSKNVGSRPHPYKADEHIKKSNKSAQDGSNDVENKIPTEDTSKVAINSFIIEDIRRGLLSPTEFAAAQARENADEDEDEDEEDDVHFKWNCNQIRSKINRLIKSGEMKVTHFQKSLNINSNSYGRFMKLTGPDRGIDNQTYIAAHRFFAKREKEGKKEVKLMRTVISAVQNQHNVDGIVLEGESDLDVDVYDTCDDVRKKIRAHLQKPNVTAAGFLRDIVKTYQANGEPDRKIQTTQLNNFLTQKGPLCGNKSAVFYAAYVFFEKLRIKEKKPKSQKRQEMEMIYINGMDRTTNFGTQRYIVPAGKSIVTDNHGRLRSVFDGSF